jgi:2-oxo-3-hexenedioate decarboxylase
MERGRLSISSQILAAYDTARLWTPDVQETIGIDVARAHAIAQDVADQRQQRGERLVGYKIGFTTEAAMASFGLSLPMWGRVWNTTVMTVAGKEGPSISLRNYVQPKLEPELVVRFHRMPDLDSTEEEIYRCISAIGVGVEIVQSHCVGWAISGPIAIADGGLHAGLVIGEMIPIQPFAANAVALNDVLKSASVQLYCDGVPRDAGAGRNVLGSPLTALRYFFSDPTVRGSSEAFSSNSLLITTGSWTAPIPVHPDESWVAQFSDELGEIGVSFCE